MAMWRRNEDKDNEKGREWQCGGGMKTGITTREAAETMTRMGKRMAMWRRNEDKGNEKGYGGDNDEEGEENGDVKEE